MPKIPPESIGSSADIAAAIAHLEMEVVRAINATADIGWPQFSEGIFLALLGALSAYLFNLLHWRMVQKRERATAHFTILSRLIAGFESAAVSYWMRDQDAASSAEQVIIKARHRAILNQRRILGTTLSGGIYTELHKKLNQFSQDIFDASTGGDFESANRKASEATATRIAMLVTDMQALIDSHRYN